MGAWAGAVDLIRHQQLTEHWTLDEAEGAFAGLALLEHLRAHDIRRHQIGGELNSLFGQAKHGTEDLGQARLGESGHADEQRVTAREDRDQDLIDDALLAENKLAYVVVNVAHTFAEGVDSVDGIAGVGGIDGCRIGHPVSGPCFGLTYLDGRQANQ